MAIGASASNQHHGQVQIFERDRGGSGNWGLVTTLSYAAAQDLGWVRAFGSSVALDGDLLLIGAEDTDVSYFYMADGAAYLFQRDAANPDHWSYVTRFIAPGADQCVGGRKLSDFWISSSSQESTEAKRCAQQDIRTSNDDFGCAVLLQGDLAVIGASFAEGQDGSYGAGAAHIFRRDGSGADQWVHVATLAPRETAQFAYFGTALALVGDTLIVGAPGTSVGGSFGQGQAHVFERNASGPDQWGETTQLAASDGLSHGDFGKAVALDGESMIVGAMGDSNSRGAAYVFAPPISPDEPSPAFPPTGELVNGGIVQGLNGVLLGALEAGLGQPLPVWIQEVEAPAQALWPGATPLGRFYNIGAVATTAAAQDEPFGLALPVPDGADTAHLAVALVGPRSWRFGDSDAEDQWLPAIGYYDPENRLFSIDLPCLFADGRTVVLVEDPNFVPLSLPDTEPSNAGPQLRLAGEQDTDFRVTCDFTDCTSEDRTAVDELLQEIYDQYTSLGYSHLALKRHTRKVTLLGIITIVTGADHYRDIYLQDDIYLPDGSVVACNGGHPAEYKSDSWSMIICYKRDDDAKLRSRARHEMFHAVQHFPPAFIHDALYVKSLDGTPLTPSGTAAIEDFQWITEGSAAAAEELGETMSRSSILPRDLHPINVALTASELSDGSDGKSRIEYQTQDFWVYFGLKNNLGLGYLKPLFDLGATAAAVDKFFANNNHATSLGAEYWGWVKNQAIEKTIDFNGALKNPGQIELDLIGTPPALAYPPGDQEPAVGGTLPRLTSEVVRIDFSASEAGGTYKVTVAATAGTGAVDGLRYKIYKEGDTNFATVEEDKPRVFDQEPTPFVVYVILSNMHYQPENSLTYQVSVSEG